jgi:hypothetical protein
VSGVPSVKVLLGPSSFAAGERGPLEKLRASGCEVIDNPYRRKLTRDELLALLEGGVEGIIAGLETLDREVMERSSLRVISRCGSGMSNVDVAAARELGIEVYSTPDAPTTAVAELTVGALLSLLRAIPARDRGVREGRWEKQAGTQLAGKTVAVVGLGRIGRRTAALLGAFGTTVIGVDPFLAGEIEGIPLLTARRGARPRRRRGAPLQRRRAPPGRARAGAAAPRRLPAERRAGRAGGRGRAAPGAGLRPPGRAPGWTSSRGSRTTAPCAGATA